MNEVIIGYIDNGIVIDHIQFGMVWKVAELLAISRQGSGKISLGDGFVSSKIGVKGILKVEGIKLSEEQLNLIALVAEKATVNIIESGEVARKLNIEIPKTLSGIIYCPNSGCISNDLHEKVNSIINYNPESGFSCYYCNREFGKQELKFKRS